MADFKISDMKMHHLEDVCEVEKLCFATPWSRNMFVGELENENAHYFAAITDDGKAIGYGGFFCVYESGEITNIAVHPTMRKHKVATEILKNITECAKILGCESLTLEVRQSNVAAQNLYQKFGFETVSVRKRYYADNGEDALLMLKKFV